LNKAIEKKKGETMKSHMLLAVSLITALVATNDFASARYQKAQIKPTKVGYNFEVRNGNLIDAPIYYRYAQHPAIGPMPQWLMPADTPWNILDKKNGFNIQAGRLFIQLSAYSDGKNPTTLLFKSAIGPRFRGPRTCYVIAHIAHPEMKVLVPPQNISATARTTGQMISEHNLSLERNLTQDELNKHVIIPADKAAEYIAPHH
jgi:hypothetical protein